MPLPLSVEKTHGSLEQGSAADFLVLDSADWRDLAYTLGGSVVSEVWIAGRREDQ